MLVQFLRPTPHAPPPPLDPRIDRPTRRQVGAICWRRDGDAVEVLLVTSRETGRWIIPKGNRMIGRSDFDAAAQEAWEEAGVRGKIGALRLGSYHYEKRLSGGGARTTAVDVYALRVKETLKDWPERRQRTRRWFGLTEAAEAVEEPELKVLIAAFEP